MTRPFHIYHYFLPCDFELGVWLKKKLLSMPFLNSITSGEKWKYCSLATSCHTWADRYPLRAVRNKDCWSAGVVYLTVWRFGMKHPVVPVWCLQQVMGWKISATCNLCALNGHPIIERLSPDLLGSFL